MLTRLKKLLFPSLVVAVLLSQFYAAVPVYAEGDDLCDGLITGTTQMGSPDAGQNFFDAHGGPNQGIYAAYYNNVVDLKIFGLGQGLAPGNRANAACVEKASGAIYGENYEYKLKGYVFNSNLGFISLNCEAGFNDAGEGAGVACGARDYGVYISEVGPDGSRKLFGYGWNSAFGWINFNMMPLSWDPGDPEPCDPQVDQNGVPQPCPPGPIVYGVSLAQNGDLSGVALSEAAVLMRFTGAKIILPDEEVPVPPVNDPEDWCEGKPYLCFQVDPYPEKLRFGFEEDAVDVNGNANVLPGEQMKVADGVEGYYVHMYLRNSTGDGPLDPAQYNVPAFTNSIRLKWTDTVKIDQTSAVQIDNSGRRMPWFSKVGAVTNKPLNFSDFDIVPGDPGHYISKLPVSSYAPTSDGNISLTTGTNPVFPFKNEQFVHDIGLLTPAPNDLALNSITFDPLVTTALPAVTVLAQGAVYPNGKVGMSLKFRPPVEVNTLYADDLQDKIVAYRSIPMNFKIGAKLWGNLGAANRAKVDFNLAYSQDDTQDQDLCEATDVFDFHFLNDLAGVLLPDESSGEQDATVKSFINTLASSLFNTEKDVQAKATLPANNVSPCATVAAPTLYTKVHYLVDGSHPEVKYYSNKVPRISGDFISNPVVVVHGNIFAQMVREIQKDVLVQTSGSVNVNIVRDTIDENLERYLSSSPNVTQKTCTITGLLGSVGANANFTVNCTNPANLDYVKFTVGDEQVLYFKNKQVVVDLDGGAIGGNAGDFGKWVVVSAGGNIFIDDNIYNGQDSNASLSLVAFRSNVEAEYFATGNVYVGPCSFGVKNIQATIIADGSLFSYSGVKKFGVPGAVGVGIDSASGEPVWSSYAEMVGSLGCQLLIEGVVSSDNTIGGANTDSGDDPKPYLLAGGGKVIKLPANLADRMKAQLYDLNYLRMFRQSIEITPEGLPKDQQCGKGLTNEDIRLIASGQPMCGNIDPCMPLPNDPNVCNGIDTLNPVSDGGDLVAPRDEDQLADGLLTDPVIGTDFDPVYIFYKAPLKDSFLFSKAGTVSVGGR